MVQHAVVAAVLHFVLAMKSVVSCREHDVCISDEKCGVGTMRACNVDTIPYHIMAIAQCLEGSLAGQQPFEPRALRVLQEKVDRPITQMD